MATTRLRKAFKYPGDSDSDAPPEGIDEQEQEELIARLQAEDETRSEFYRKVFLAAPILSCLAYPLLVPPTFGLTTTLLCISSLIFSAYLLWSMPLSASTNRLHVVVVSSPLEQYLPILNTVLAAMLATGSLVTRGQDAVMEGDFLLSMLPMLMCTLVWGLKSELRNVDVHELSKLKYNYKGA